MVVVNVITTHTSQTKAVTAKSGQVFADSISLASQCRDEPKEQKFPKEEPIGLPLWLTLLFCSPAAFSSVRISTIPAFGTIMETVTQKEVGNRLPDSPRAKTRLNV